MADVVAEWNAVIARVWQAIEVVLRNDGHTRVTTHVLAGLTTRYPRLRVVSNPTNGGYGRALASAIAATRGTYVATIDSDGQFELADAVELTRELERGG